MTYLNGLSVPDLVDCPAWQALTAHHRELKLDQTPGWSLSQAFRQDPERAARLTLDAPGLRVDTSKTQVTETTRQLLFQLAQERALFTQREALWQGHCVNPSENRAALHVLLRTPPEAASQLPAALHATWATMQDNLSRVLAYASWVRAQTSLTDVVHLGTGGSDLGPRFVVGALGGVLGRASETIPESHRIRVHFVSNVDGTAMSDLLHTLKPESTLFIVASKTFSTTETLMNAELARDWVQAHYKTRHMNEASSAAPSSQPFARWHDHFCALTSAPDQAQAWGIERFFLVDPCVGGRYSLWSAMGLPVAIALGPAAFQALLAGAHALDEHFFHTAGIDNLPVWLGLLDIWQHSIQGFTSRCVLPYHNRLAGLIEHLQQLEMESNGKGVDAHRHRPLNVPTSPVIWGQVGTNAQHAFLQLVHQSPQTVPTEFIVPRRVPNALPAHTRFSQASALAQAQALMDGYTQGPAFEHCPGHRPSVFVVLEELSPYGLGALLAFYEHRVFVSGALLGINSFDQWGVELGKRLTRSLASSTATASSASAASHELDASTTALWHHLQG
jgi:glucose-6-phosphate isomerase